MGRKFTRPLTHLANGADAFRRGDLSHRIPESGQDEFATVAGAMNEMARQVSEQIKRLEDDARRRRQFLADVAHELRSPVTTLQTMIAAMNDGLAEDPARREFAMSALATTSQRLGRLVQDLMDLARLEVTELTLSLREVDLRELAASSIRAHEAQASAAGVVLHPLERGPGISATVDPDRISQVLDNVLENAINYGQGVTRGRAGHPVSRPM
jgi:two-component system sensor histidine kinase MtrB